MRAGAPQTSGDITRAWVNQDGVLYAVLRDFGPVVLPPYDGDPASLSGRRVKLIDGRWLLNGAAG